VQDYGGEKAGKGEKGCQSQKDTGGKKNRQENRAQKKARHRQKGSSDKKAERERKNLTLYSGNDKAGSDIRSDNETARIPEKAVAQKTKRGGKRP
jgi:hypothetical protein